MSRVIKNRINAMKPWTDEQDREMISLLADGRGYTYTGRKLGRSSGAIAGRVSAIKDWIKEELQYKSAPIGLFGAGTHKPVRPSDGCHRVEEGTGFCPRGVPLTDGVAELGSVHRTNSSEAECGQCGYTTDKCSCSYGV
jgi:hypothetical protein